MEKRRLTETCLESFVGNRLYLKSSKHGGNW